MTTSAATDEAAQSRAALAKVGWRILPILALGYGIAYMDRVNIGFASAQMNADLGFSAAVYGFGGGLFFLIYAFCEVPSNLLLDRFGARLWISRIMLTWGILSAAMMFVHTPIQFYILRGLLGAAEAGFFPGVVVYLSRWYPLATRSRAVSAFYVAVPLSSVVMGGLAGLLLGLDGHFGLRGWQWLFLLEGLPAVLLSVVVFLFLPESVRAVSWLTEPEKRSIEAHLDRDVAHHDPHETASVFKAMTNPIVLTVGAANFLFLGTNYTFTLSAPPILMHLTGLDIGQVGYLTAVGGLCGAAAMLANAWHADHTREHFLHVIVPFLALGLGFLVLAFAVTPAMAITGYLLTMASSSAVNGVFIVLLTGLLSPRQILVGVAAETMIGQFGSFVLPSLWGLVRQASPGEVTAGLYLLPIPFALGAAILGLVWLATHRRNLARAALAAA